MKKLIGVLAVVAVACGSGARAVERPAPAAAGGPVDVALLRTAGIERAALRCNSENRFGSELRSDSAKGAEEMMAVIGAAAPVEPAARAELQERLRSLLFWRMVRAVLIEGNNNNLGAIPLAGHTWIDATGAVRPVVVFRSGITPTPAADGSCFRSLLEDGGVRHVVNLFDGKIPVADLVDGERAAAEAHGATYVYATDDAGTGYGRWRDALKEHYDDPAQRDQAFRAIARLVREQILFPGGAAPKGNIHLHCGGGMHRSGIIAGIVEKCVNRAPMEQVLAHYRFHVAYQDDAHPGGYEAGNEQVLRDFDCALVDAPAAAFAPLAPPAAGTSAGEDDPTGAGTAVALGGGSIGARPPGRGVARLTSVDQPPATGTLDKDVIRRVVAGHVPAVRTCYERELLADPSLAGRVTARFRIDDTGRVVASEIQSSTLESPKVERCIEREVRAWTFPPPTGGAVIVSYPFVLTAAD